MIVGEEEDPLEHSNILSRMVFPNEGEEVISRGRLVQQFAPCEFRGVGRMRRYRVAVLLAVVEDTLQVVLSSTDGFDVGVVDDVVVCDVEETGISYVGLPVESEADVVVGVTIGMLFTANGVVFDDVCGCGE